MKVKHGLFAKFQKQFNKQMTTILKNPDHRHFEIVSKHGPEMLENAEKFFLIIYNLQLLDYLIDTASRVLIKAPLQAVESKAISQTSLLDSILDITQKAKLLDQIEYLINRQDPVYMAANVVKVKKAFFEASVNSYANYRLENIRSFSKVRKSVCQLEFYKQVTDAIGKYVTTTGQSILGIDEVKFEKSDTGKLKVPSLRYLNSTVGTILSKEEQYNIMKLKSIKAIAELADSLKRRRKFTFNIKSDFVTVLIVEMAQYFEGV